MDGKPTPPDSLPKYLAEGLPKQNNETLRDTLLFVEKLIEWNSQPPEVDVDEGEELVDVEEQGTKGTIVTKKVPCGKDCDGCPHGPYDYRVYRDGGDVVWEYIGKTD